MASPRSIFATALLSAAAVAQGPVQQNCAFWFEDVGYNFDLTPLASGAPYQYTYGAKNYLYTFCGTLNNNPCPNNVVGSSVQLPPGSNVGCLNVLGSWAKAEASLLTADPTQGLKLVYQGGMPCGQFESYSTTFNLQCDPSVPLISYVDVSEPTQCSLQYNLKSSAACPVQKFKTVPSLGPGWIVFIVFVVAIFAYVAGGSLYKRLVKGASGVEALPNIDTWRSVWAFITCKNTRSGSSRYMQASDLEDAGGAYFRADGDSAVAPTSKL